MTIQMREGWVLCRGGNVDYATPNTGLWSRTHPWRLRNEFWTITNDGRWGICDNDRDSRDIIELLDPWDARVPEEHREKRFVVGTHFSGGQESPCVFDRKEMVGAGFTVSYSGSEIERVAMWCNADFESGRAVGFSWYPKHMLTLDGKPCNPDGSPIAEQPKPVDEPVPAVEPESLPYKVVDQPSRTTRTLDACGWRVYGITEGNDRPRVVLEPDNRDNELSVEAARAYAAAILAVCEEIER